MKKSGITKQTKIKKEPIPNRLKALRKEKGLTQAQLAEKIGVSRDTINCYENNRPLQLENAMQLADLYGVSLDYLYCRSDFRKVDNEHINKVMGLSDDAITNIKSLTFDQKFLLDCITGTAALNQILESLELFIFSIPPSEIEIFDYTSGQKKKYSLGAIALKNHAMDCYNDAITKLFEVSADQRQKKMKLYIEQTKLELEALRKKQKETK